MSMNSILRQYGVFASVYDAKICYAAKNESIL